MACLWLTIVLMQRGWMMVESAVDTTAICSHTLSKKNDAGDCPTWLSKTDINAGPSSILEHTVQQILLGMGPCNRHPTHIPLLTKHCHLCLYWACNHYNWTTDKGQSGRSDEWFVIHYVNGCVKVYCLLVISYSTNITGHTQASGGDFMLWEMGISETLNCDSTHPERKTKWTSLWTSCIFTSHLSSQL